MLSAARLREVHDVVRQAAGRLADPSAQDLLAELDERLGWAGISTERWPPVRSYARHSSSKPPLCAASRWPHPARPSDRDGDRGTPAGVLERFASAGQLCRQPRKVS